MSSVGTAATGGGPRHSAGDHRPRTITRAQRIAGSVRRLFPDLSRSLHMPHRSHLLSALLPLLCALAALAPASAADAPPSAPAPAAPAAAEKSGPQPKLVVDEPIK